MRRHLWAVSRTVLPMRHVFDFNQALMDFGATLCTARKPQVPDMPDADGVLRLALRARTRPTGRMTLGRVRVIVVTAAVIERDGTFLVTRRPRGVHLEGYWEFPGGKCEPGETLRPASCGRSREELDSAVTVGAELFAVAHTVSGADGGVAFFCV